MTPWIVALALIGLLSAVAAEAVPVVQATITWSYNPAETEPVTAVQIERKTGAAGAWTRLPTVTPPATTLVDTGLALGTTYCYRVIPSNQAGDGPPAPPTGACVPIPGPPTQPLIPGDPNATPPKPFISVTLDGVTVTITISPGP